MSRITRFTNRPWFLALGAAVAFVLLSGCAYYNTFYNIKKEFRAAERQTARSTQGAPEQQAVPGRPATPGQPRQGGTGTQQYMTIIESCGNLLEFYPKSRWVDDALMVMGISYYRVNEFTKAERKFTELVTIFPKSKHVEMATIWRARSVLAQGKLDDAERVLTKDETVIKTSDAKAAYYRTLAQIYDEREQPEEAAESLEKIGNISYSRTDKATDMLVLGRSYAALKQNDKARTALLRTLDLTRIPEEAYDARKLLATLAAEDSQYAAAKSYLLPLRTDLRFAQFAGEVQLELAKVEAMCGDPALAITMLEALCAESPSGDLKARALYLQGEVARNKLADFELAKAKFDSVSAAGAARSLQDSARQDALQLETGLNALRQIPILADSLAYLLEHPPMEDESSEEAAPSPVLSIAEITADTTADTAEDSLTVGSLIADSLSSTEELVIADSTASGDSAIVENVSQMTPAEMIADSIMRALMQDDSTRRAELLATDSASAPVDSIILEVQQSEQPEDSQSVLRGPSERDIYELRLGTVSRSLVIAHLEAATFMQFIDAPLDSVLAHLEAAAYVQDQSPEHWRAQALLAVALVSSANESDQQRGTDMLSEIAYSESAPIGLRNLARNRSGLPLLEVEETEQVRAYRTAESLLLAGAGTEDVLVAYRNAASSDSLTLEGSRSLLAIAYLEEYQLRDLQAAVQTHEALLRLFPDSAFAEISRAKLAEPDSNSIFLMSEEALEASFQPASDLLSTESDSTGWPPDPETLRGRRFR